MRSFKIIFPLGLILVFLFTTSCFREEEGRTRSDEVKELADYLLENEIFSDPTWTGLYFFPEIEGTGDYPEYYDSIYIEFKGYLLDGTEIANSASNDGPYLVVLWDWQVIPGINEALSMMKKGGKARAIIPSTLAYGNANLNSVEPFSTLIYDLEIVDVKPGRQVEPYQTTGLTKETSPTGLEYYWIHRTENEQVTEGRYAKIHYTGYLMDGRIFDSTVKRDEPANLDPINLIPGFSEAILLMKVGEKMRAIIPSDLAYGSDYGFPVIPPYSTLIFDIEIMEVL